MILSRSWLLLTLPIAVVAIGLLSWTVLSLVRTVRRSVVASLPIQEQQVIDFDRAGAFALSVEGEFGRRLGDLQFSLASAERGTAIPLHRILFRTNVASFSRARVELYSFTLPSPGAYALRVLGADASTDYGRDAIVFTQRFTGTLVAHIIALIVLGSTLIGSIVASGLALSGGSLHTIDASATLEGAIARSAAVVRARTIVHAGPPRYEVTEVLAGAVPPNLAGAGQAAGLLLDMQRPTADGYAPVDGQEVILLLEQPSSVPSGSVMLGEPIALLPLNGGRMVYAPREPGRLELTLEDLRRRVKK